MLITDLDQAVSAGDEVSVDLPSLQVAILYDEAEAGRRAARAAYSAVDHAGEIGLQLHLWRLDILSDPTLRDQATGDIAGADLVLISVNDGGVPLSLCNWLAQAIANKTGSNSAVVVLVQGDCLLTGGLKHQLDSIRTKAAEACLDFFAPEPDLKVKFDAVRRRAGEITPTLHTMLNSTRSDSFTNRPKECP